MLKPRPTWYLIEEIPVKSWGARHPGLPDGGSKRHLIGPFTRDEADLVSRITGLTNSIFAPDLKGNDGQTRTR